MLRDSKYVSGGADLRTMDVKLVGNGSLIVSNAAANFASLVDGQYRTTLDMRDLNYFYAEVNRLPLGDYRAYPNFSTNGWVGSGTGNEVSRFAPLIWLARTNIIKAGFVDPTTTLTWTRATMRSRSATTASREPRRICVSRWAVQRLLPGQHLL